jgi:hypothetical protein
MRIASSQRKISNDVLDRLEKIIEEKKKAHPEGSCHRSTYRACGIGTQRCRSRRDRF